MDDQGLAGEFYLSTGTYRAVYHKPLHVFSQRGIEIFVYDKIDLKRNYVRLSIYLPRDYTLPEALGCEKNVRNHCTCIVHM